VAECAPGLEEALAADGFALQGRYPVMTLPAEQLREVPAPDGRGHRSRARGRRRAALLATAAEAFGDGPPPTRRSPPTAGAGHLARADGEPAGAAFHSAIADGVSELGGIGVRERFRRRGIAAALPGLRRPPPWPPERSCASSRPATTAPSACTPAPASPARAPRWFTWSAEPRAPASASTATGRGVAREVHAPRDELLVGHREVVVAHELLDDPPVAQAARRGSRSSCPCSPVGGLP
jgi:hypothetical protein